jgi:long-chain acyl-CoA synthetase
MTQTVELGAPIEALTVAGAFQRTVANFPGKAALRTRDGSLSLTWSELGAKVAQVAAGLAALGIGPGDTVALLLPNTPECHILDLAALHLGAVPFTIYNTSSPEQIHHKLEVSGCGVLFTEEQFAAKAADASEGLPALRRSFIVDRDGERLEDVEALGSEDFDFAAAWGAIAPESPVTLIFTSGTTGPPKAALWAHRTVMSQLGSLAAAVPMADENILSVLPMAHAGGRLTGHYFALIGGATITTVPDMRDLAVALGEVHPDTLFSVPRVWEKLQVAIESMIEALPEAEREAVKEGMRTGSPTQELTPILARLGLERFKVGFVGGAPSAPALAAFFRSVGVPMLEAYGCTEGSLSIFNRVDEFKLGSAGKPLPGVEIMVAEDGELFQRGGLNFLGYLGQPEQTAEALDADGWLHTGDIVEVDDDGFVTIIDRKKEIIISAAGKNMSPANIEQSIKGESSLIGQVVTIGDGRRYNTALITLDPEAAAGHATRHGLDGASFAEIAAAPETRTVIEAAVERGNERLARVEQIKKFTILTEIWMPDTDVLTPTMKLKRKPIAARYAETIEALYAE